ncbi:hypothetical protein [Rivibacter subsaxonicus]|uniref:Uncharacterized protein n=1 Tax=Rivibacter subsaxonicus TaxID=457575 RepID=A0A4Q7VZQ6_9BURK|nr:hypothetical protein [Rivibacter subsaxonicus]RZU02347.1 hypothetical protein EV670_0370 [Rivibacter subsaxonicus]
MNEYRGWMPCEAEEESVDVANADVGIEALVAGTLALMTGVAEHAPASPMRCMMARKAAANLLALAHHPQTSQALGMTVLKLRAHWQRIASEVAEPACMAAGPGASRWKH